MLGIISLGVTYTQYMYIHTYRHGSGSRAHEQIVGPAACMGSRGRTLQATGLSCRLKVRAIVYMCAFHVGEISRALIVFNPSAAVLNLHGLGVYE